MSHSSDRPTDVSKKAQRRQYPTWLLAVVAAGVSGALMASCYWPLRLHGVAWIALVPWLVILPRVSAEKAWVHGIVLGLVFYRLAMGWMFGLAGPLAGTLIIVFSFWMGFSFRVARLLMERFGTRAMLWAVPLAFAGQEIIRAEGLPLYRFAYLAWGYSQSPNYWIARMASIGGVYLVTLVLVAFNAAVAYGLLRRRVKAWIPAMSIAGVAIVLAAVSQPARDTGPAPAVPVACVQGEDLPYHEYLALTREAIEHPLEPVFIVLPEHTVPEITTINHRFISSLADLAREHGVYICVGAHIDASPDAACPYDNVAMLIGPTGEIVATQAKAVPVPFFQDGNPATSQPAVDTEHGRVGMYVCYDATFTDVPRRLAAKGVRLFLAPLMDPDRWPVQQCWQHADMACFRSIELGLPAVRAASSGVSQIVDRAGRIVGQRTREEGPGVLCAAVTLGEADTIFARGGYLFATVVGVAFLAIVGILTVADWVQRPRAHRARRAGSPTSSPSGRG